MFIRREDVDGHAVDFSSVWSGRWLPAAHPDQFHIDEFLTPLGLSVCALAGAPNVPQPR